MTQSPIDPRLYYETGNLFSPDYGFDGLAVFVPSGLTGFRIAFKQFVEENRSDIVAVADTNENHRIYTIDEVPTMVHKALTMLLEHHAVRIGMNAIRTTRGAGPSEKAVIDATSSWLEKHKDLSNIQIVLVDLRGGFEKYDAIL